MKRPLADIELPSFEFVADKQLCNRADDDDYLDDLHLRWPQLWNKLLCAGDASISQSSDIPTNNDLDGLVAPSSEPSLIAADVGQRIDEWTRTITGSTAAGEGEDVEQYRENSYCDRIKEGQICLGMICGSTARLIGDMQYINAKMKELDPDQKTFSVSLQVTDQYVFMVTEDSTQIGQVNDATAETLRLLSGISSVELKAHVDINDTLRRTEQARRLHDSVVKIDIEVYSSTSDRDETGRILSVRKVYLQHSLYLQDDIEYDNPHMIIFEGLEAEHSTTSTSALHTNIANPIAVDEIIADVCKSETRDRGLQGLKPDIRLKTELLPHQEQALEFMVQREVGPLPKDFQLWDYVVEGERSGYRHRISKCWLTSAPMEIGCGILADDMGMGKTLSTLSLVTRRLPEAIRWSHVNAEADFETKTGDARSRATLIVVSSLLIMNGWFKELEEHLDGTLSVVKYHGKNRHARFVRLKDCDIVFTTYHTLAAERKTKRNTLKSIRWFRIVLDEAHTVRRQATTLFAAVNELESEHRWCLTGTPIQNTLADLGSLLGFLQIYPFDRASMFRKYIIAPFLEDMETATANLRMLLNSVCLRRSITRLKLPPLDEHIEYLDLTEEERQQYTRTLEGMIHAATYGSRERFSDTPFGKFQIQLQLRIVCNHGTFQRPYDSGQDATQEQREDAISSLGNLGESKCSCCHQSVLAVQTNCAVDSNALLSEQVLCDECKLQLLADRTESLLSIASGNALQVSCSPSAEHSIPSSHMLDTSQKRGFNPEGCSSKMETLVRDVKSDLDGTKSIIFSCWTRSLNLVAWHLDQCRIRYLRIDGDTEMSQRQGILDEYESSDEIRILLMTTGTGAYGLNLAVANRVFILEPQWNPSIESQAVARVQRFLQTQTVRVVRYIVRGTVEEDIRRQQMRKEADAERGF